MPPVRKLLSTKRVKKKVESSPRFRAYLSIAILSVLIVLLCYTAITLIYPCDL